MPFGTKISGKLKVESEKLSRFFYKVAEVLEATLLDFHHNTPTTTTIK